MMLLNRDQAALFGELALALPPFLQAADPLHLSDNLEGQSFLELQVH